MAKKLVLLEEHKALGAKIIPFAGFDMAVSYSGINDEHLNVRKSVGVFDVSHMGEFFVTGEQALDFLQYVTTNDVAKLEPGKIQYSCMPNGKGGIIDDLLVYNLANNQYMLVVNASNIDKDWQWLNQHAAKFGVDMSDNSDSYSLLAVQGPKATDTLQKLTNLKLSDIKYYTFVKGEIGGIDNVIISATGYTGSGGFELYVKNENAVKLWKQVFEAGKEFEIKPAGLGCRDTLRLEMGFCLYGNDIDDTTSPIEAGLGWITKFNKDFIDKDLFLKQKNEGIKKRLVGIELLEKGVPRHGYTILNSNKEEIGIVTSGTQSPSLGKAIAMGYVNKPFTKKDTEVYIKIRKKEIKSKIVKLPFIIN